MNNGLELERRSDRTALFRAIQWSNQSHGARHMLKLALAPQPERDAKGCKDKDAGGFHAPNDERGKHGSGGPLERSTHSRTRSDVC